VCLEDALHFDLTHLDPPHHSISIGIRKMSEEQGHATTHSALNPLLMRALPTAIFFTFCKVSALVYLLLQK
jgi:hypothetical protein